MAFQLCDLHFTASSLLFLSITISALEYNFLGCQETSPDASGHRCSSFQSKISCQTFAILRANPCYSSLSNLSYYLGLDVYEVANTNGFSADTEFLPQNQPVLIPITCRCNGKFYGADLIKTAIKGESFVSVAESLEGLTTCKAIKERNPRVPPWKLKEQAKVTVPLRCACPASLTKSKFLVSYPVSEGDTVSDLAKKFSTTWEAIESANTKSLSTFKPEKLQPLTSLLIPLDKKPIFDPLAKPHVPNSKFPSQNITVENHNHKKKHKKSKIKVYVAVICTITAVSIAAALALLLIHFNKNKTQNLITEKDMERQQLSLSVRTASDKKISFEGSQDALDTQTADRTPRKLLLEMYTIEELNNATEDFNPSNHIDGSVYFGMLKAKSMAIKKITKQTIEKIDFSLLNDASHFHPNIIRLMGTCFSENESDAFLVFEYAKNGSLKDWLHGGLAVKNQFIASCDCFLNWDQRLKLCFDVAMALLYMHQKMKPAYVHQKIRSRNVFLDEEFNAKVGNFGMPNCTEEEEGEKDQDDSHSRAYLAPEYANHGIISPSIDVFAYGIVLIEVVTGEPPNVSALERLNKLISEPGNSEDFREWIDESLGENYSLDSVVALMSLARDCVKEEAGSRPQASEIVERISRLLGEQENEQGGGLEEGECVLVCESSIKPLVKADSASSTGL